MSSGVGIPSPTIISFGTHSNTLYLFDLIPILKPFSAFSHTCISFLLVGQVNPIHFNTIVAMTLISDSN